MFVLEISEQCSEDIKFYSDHDALLRERIKKKVDEILRTPFAYKPMRAPFYGLYRVHIGPFVLIFRSSNETGIVQLIRFKHHDKAYEL